MWKKEAKKTPEAGEKREGVHLYSRMAKRHLRVWPTETGNCIMMTGKVENEKDQLSMKHIVATSASDNSEWCLRPHKAISQLAASVKSVEPFLSKHFGSSSNAPLGKNGLREFAMLFETEEGKDFLKSCEMLDASCQKEVPRDSALKKSIAQVVDFFAPGDRSSGRGNDMHRQLTRVAIVSSRLYLASMSLLEANALMNNRNSWAEKIDGMRGEWLENPDKRNSWWIS